MTILKIALVGFALLPDIPLYHPSDHFLSTNLFSVIHISVHFSFYYPIFSDMTSIPAPLENKPSIQAPLESHTCTLTLSKSETFTETFLDSEHCIQPFLENQPSTPATLESELSTQACLESEPFIQTPPGSQPSIGAPLECQQWMSDLRLGLKANSIAHYTFISKTRARILLKHTGRIQPNLQANLMEKLCSLAREQKSSRWYHRVGRYKQRATNVKRRALPTIPEFGVLNPGIPKMPRLSEKRPLASWIKESLEVYRKYIASDLVDASIKPRIKRIRQCLWVYGKTGKGIGMAIAKGNKPSRSDLQSLSTEVAVMLTITSKITRYTQILDESAIDASFRPRVVEIIGILRSYQKRHFRSGLNIAILSQFEKEIQDHLKARSPAESIGVHA